MTVLQDVARRAPARGLRRGLRSALAVGGWLVALVLAVAVGRLIGDRDGAPLYLGAAPFVGSWDLRVGPLSLCPVIVGAFAVVLLPRMAATMRWRPLLLTGVVIAAAWAVALALVDGVDALAAPLSTRFEYLADVPTVRRVGIAEFLRTFTDRIGDYAVHTRGHPPGFVLLAASLDRVGIGGPWPIAALCIAAGASSVAAATIAVRAVASEEVARQALPFVALAPAAIWIATSADGLYLGVTAWGLALLALSSARVGRASLAWAAAGGVVLGLALHLSYGVGPLGVLALLIMLRMPAGRSARVLAAGAGLISVAAVFAAYGFWWPAGFAATHVQWALGVGPTRPQWYFVVANLAVFATAVGPAAIAGVARISGRGVGLLVAGGIIAVVLADLSGISPGEVERIWLPFTPWLLVAAAGLDRRRAWLAAQVSVGVLLQVSLLSKW